MKNKTNRQTKIIIFLSILCILCPGFSLFSEEPITDFNTHYMYPFSFGVEYQNLIPISDFVEDFNFILFDVSGTLEMPLQFFPQIKPHIRGGAAFTLGENRNIDNDYPDNKYDHTTFYCGFGVGYSHRFSKILEAGLEVSGGIDYSSFPFLHPDETTRGAFFSFIDVRLPLTINPIYNLSIDLQPGIRYRKGLSPLYYFDGFLFSIGGTINFRLGEDPDISGLIRSIRFNETSLSTIFAGMQSFYSQHPAGTVSITNVEKYSIRDIKVSFYQAGFMDSPTPAAAIEELKPGETREIPVFASFNSEIFNTDGVVPLTGEVIVMYSAKDKPGKQTESVVYDLYDKTALTWDDDRKVGAYITPSDSVIKDYASFIKQSGKEKQLITYNDPLQTAMLVYSALIEAGCLYQADPIRPFVSVQQDTQLIDTISLPRDTLKRITGDCDDLTVLYTSLLETLGIESGFITIPGHIYPVFNTGVPARHYRKIHPERSMTINVNGMVWVPVEVTMIGKGDFLKAWEAGAREWIALDDNPEKRKFYITREAQNLYRPVGLKKTNADFSFGSARDIAAMFENNLAHLSDLIINNFKTMAEDTAHKSDYNKLGIIYAYFNEPGKAEKAFQNAVALDPGYSLAVINLGNLFFQTGRFDDALSQYFLALHQFKESDGPPTLTYLKLLLKISVVYYELKQYNEAKEYYFYAQDISPEEAAQYSYLKNTEQGDTRSSELPGHTLVLQYMEDEDILKKIQ